MWKNKIVANTLESPDQLLAHYANPRTHDGKQRDTMRASLDELGIIAPCTVNDRTGNMIDGHMRTEEYLTAGVKEVPVIHLDLSEEDELKAIAYFDAVGTLAGYNPEKLEDLLQQIDFVNEPLENMLTDLLDDKPKVLPDGIDDIPDVETPVSKLGDLWLLNGHRVLCGDSTDKQTVELLMDGKKADMMFTDPPYGVDYEGGHFHSGNVNIKRKREKLSGDATTDLYAPMVAIACQFVDGPCYTFFAGTKSLALIQALDAQAEIHAMLIWHKINATYAAMNSQYKQRHEPFLYWKPKGCTLRWKGASTENTLWELKKDGKNDFHPTQKPVELVAKALNNHSAKTVLDLFLGSGSTLIACEQTDRICYGLELDEHYVDVICKRWQTLTGQMPILESTGEAHDFATSDS